MEQRQIIAIKKLKARNGFRREQSQNNKNSLTGEFNPLINYQRKVKQLYPNSLPNPKTGENSLFFFNGTRLPITSK